MRAEQRREERAAQKRFRELERRAKEQAKLSALEQARLEVERFENELEVLLSVHKECGEVCDWLALAVSLPPHTPRRFSHCETKTRHQAELAGLRQGHEHLSQSDVGAARLADDEAFELATQAFLREQAEWQRLNELAPRVLAGEHTAYIEALSEFSPFTELAHLGSSIHFTVHDARLVECVLRFAGRKAIPSNAKSLTAAGKVSVKAMPKARFHEIYQDYVCGCLLRVTREVFALLPIDTVLIAASVDALDSITGRAIELPVLSVAIRRSAHDQLNYAALDPSDTIESFLHRGDFKASRKTGEFVRVVPLTPADLPTPPSTPTNLYEFVSTLQRLRDEIRTEIQGFTGALIGNTV